ncbi:hypothetical protein UA08_03152 [Talaromyces atroroseus]|uniref:Protein kinase domain-containing protein n=1 Tax=Talaromyces atroroseus TaxID=1441469 RepID=A0A225AK04_TALAT|nr:hypothetical protein UA08_03152 [Talaromyces atroroseus]OKL61200.1 hypothetical protein UA08_03152 [Talaromyces atroroseus]
MERPVARKVLADRHVYFSRPPAVSSGSPILCDFGGASVQSSRNRGNVMYDVYRPPEIILDMEWDTKIDIWGLCLMVWRMLEGNHLFSAHKSGALNNEQHLAEMVSLMGPPPLEFLRRSPISQRYWDEEAMPIGLASI